MLPTRRTDTIRIVLAFLCLLSGRAFAEPHLVLDINQHLGPINSNPTGLGKLGDIALIAAQIPEYSTKTGLIRSDGTPGGTSVIHTFAGTGPLPGMYGYPTALQSGSNAYFTAYDDASGNELWVTDGTAAGTHIVKDITADATNDAPRILGTYQGGIAFVVHDPTQVYQLYITDGTAAGTKQLTSFAGQDHGVTGPSFAVVNGKMYFPVTPEICCSLELWVSDGTPAGTHILSGLTTIGPAVNPRSMRAVGNRLVFVGETASNGKELIALDTTTETFSIIDVAAGADSGVRTDLTLFNGFAYFVGGPVADTDLWRTDGTPAGTIPVTNFNLGLQASWPFQQFISVLGNRLVFTADDGTHGPQLWSTTGNPGGETALSAVPSQTSWGFFAETNRYLYAVANNLLPGGSRQVFVTDGTPAGTQILPNVANANSTYLSGVVGDATADYLSYSYTESPVQPASSVFRYSPGDASVLTPVKIDARAFNNTAAGTFLVSNGKVLYNFDDGTTGNELWVGDSSGTRELFDIAPEITTDSSFPLWLTQWNDKAVFSADDGVHGRELWVSDGTAAGTHIVADIAPGTDSAEPRNLVVWGDALYFFAWGADGSDHLMRLSTPTATPETLASLTPLTFADIENHSPPYCFGGTSAVLGNKLYLSASGDSAGYQLWATDGTSAGTKRATEINPSTTRTQGPCDLTVLGNRLYFTADGGPTNGGNELWTTDGTVGGTHIVKDMAPGPVTSDITSIGVVGGKLLFVASNGSAGGRQTYISDGSDAGTSPLLDTVGFQGYPSASFNGKLFLLGVDPSLPQGSYGLWITDGTASGTVRISGVTVDANVPPTLGAAGLYFVNAAESDREPWVSDGTSAGTRRVADLNSSGSSNVQFMGDFRGVMLMVSNDSNGSRIWRTDGTPTGTHLLGAGPAAVGSNDVFNLPVVPGQNLLYAGSGTQPGIELYVVPNERPTAVADAATASNGQGVTISVLSNDADPDGSLAPTGVRIVQLPAHGTSTVGSSGAITYVPTAGYSGADSFTYVARDDQGFESNAATVTLNVTAAPPVSGGGGSGGGGSGGKGGGGALGAFEALVLALFAALACIRRSMATEAAL